MKGKGKKKKPKKRPKAPPCLTIELVEDAKPDPKEAHASRSESGQIRFHNATKRGRTVTFDLWPFVEPPHSIYIKAHKYSPCLTIYAGQPLGGYTYNVLPALDPGGPPGGPEVVVDP
jgi:hypothetical protein